jgi:acrylyl-CoA reductase (NADPH)
MDFPGTVAPFILRGVTLYGVESVMAPPALRLEAWTRLARDLDATKLEALTSEVSLAGAMETAADILAGKVRGRTVVDVNR